MRFVALIAVGWTSARVALLWPDGATLTQAIDEAFVIQSADASNTAPVAAMPDTIDSPAPPARTAPRQRTVHAELSAMAQGPVDRAVDAPAPVAADQPVGAPPGVIPQAVPLSQAVPSPSRWSASGWFVTRRGAPAGGAMLGGDQAGLRVAYGLGATQRVRLYARATAPLATAGRELAAGIEWQPTTLPVRVAAEQRVGVDGNRGGPTVTMVGGIDSVALPLAFKLEAYGQVGAVWRERLDPFADGALRALREVGQVGAVRIGAGAGAWGAAQREATRIDIGPSVVASVPLGEQAVKIAIDWRQRIAGDARPGSGPALSVGADF